MMIGLEISGHYTTIYHLLYNFTQVDVVPTINDPNLTEDMDDEDQEVKEDTENDMTIEGRLSKMEEKVGKQKK